MPPAGCRPVSAGFSCPTRSSTFRYRESQRSCSVVTQNVMRYKREFSPGRVMMPKTIEHIHWPDAPDLWMPYAPAIKVKGGTTVYLAGVTAAPVYHHHPHRPEEFDAMPRDMAGQARAALENLKRGLEAVGATFADIVTADRFVTDLTDQDALNRVWGEYFGAAKPATTTVQVVRLATDPRCLVEINAIAVID